MTTLALKTFALIALLALALNLPAVLTSGGANIILAVAVAAIAYHYLTKGGARRRRPR